MHSSLHAWSRALLVLPLLLLVVPALAQTTIWTASGTGDFTVGSNWSSGVPNSTTDAAITNGNSGTPTVANLNGANRDVANLSVGAFDTLNVNPNSVFNVYGSSISNAGSINLTAGSNSNSFLQLQGSTTLSGGGTVTMGSADGTGAAYILQGPGGLSLTNANNSIQGYGVIGNGGLTLINQAGGTINANSSGNTLNLNGGGGITNTGTLEATNGGILNISQSVANGGGAIIANGGNVDFTGGLTITGGTLVSQNGGALLNSTNVNLDGSTAAGAVTISAGSTWTSGPNSVTDVNGAISNIGAISVIAGSNSNSFLSLQANTTLSGGGTVTLGSADGTGAAYIVQGPGGLTLTNADNTIQGYGVIGNGGLTVINQAAGTINANSSGNTLTLNGNGGVANMGILEATSGGILNINNMTVSDVGDRILGNGGSVQIENATIIGGALTATNGGTFNQGVNGTSVTLDGLTAGPLTISSGTTWNTGNNSNTYVQGSIVNDGAIAVTAGGNSNSTLNLQANTTLSGGGTVTMGCSDGTGTAYIVQGPGGLTLTNADNTIQGYGVIGNGGLTVINQAAGTINANSSGNTLTLNGNGGITNMGILEATSGGILNINNMTVSDVGDRILGNGGSVQIENATIIGGALTATNGGTFNQGVNGTSVTLDGLTAGPLTISSGTTWNTGNNSNTYVQGSIVNDGAIAVTAGGNSNSTLNLQANTTLSGGGTVTMGSSDGTGTAYIVQGPGGLTLTNADNTIQGYGVIGNGGLTVINQAAGTINANSSGNTLTLNGNGGITNMGMLEATSGGILNINNMTVSDAGDRILADGGGVQIVNATIIGGALTATNGGTFNQGVNGTSVTLDGLTAGPLTISSGTTWNTGNNSNTYVQGSIVNDGAIAVTAGSNSNSVLNLQANTTLSGGGTVTLGSADGTGAAYIVQGPGGLTLTNADNTIQGYGVIGNGGLTVVNQAAGTINANSSGNTLTLNGNGGITNMGMLEATSGGILNINNMTVSDAGDRILADGGGVQIENATIIGGALTATNGGTFNQGVNGTSVMLDGLTQSGSTPAGITISSGTTWNTGNNSNTYVQGSIVNDGAIVVTAGSNSNSVLNLQANTTLSGGGIVTMGSSDGTGAAYIVQGPGGLTLTNADNTIQGYGVIGNGGLTVFNGPAGTLLADSPGNTLLINGSSNLTNNGTLQANAGSTLEVTSNLDNFGGNTLTDGTYVVNGSPSATGTLQLNLGGNTGGEIVNNAASIVLNGPAANTRFIDSNGNDALANLAANATASSSFTVEGGYGFQTAGDFSNAGTVVVEGNGSSLTVGPGGGNTYVQTGGSTLVDSGGTLSAQAVSLSGGALFAGSSSALGSCPVSVSGGSLFVCNNAAMTNPLTFGSGTIGGLGTFAPIGGVVIGTMQVVAPGITNSFGFSFHNTGIGTLGFGTGLTLASGGTYQWALGDASGASGGAGIGWDEILVTGTLTITATPGQPFALTIFPASGGTLYSGQFVFNDTQNYSWTIASASGGIVGFDPDAITIDSSAFSSLLGPGQFFLNQTGNDLMLNFTPVPEPSTSALMGLGLAVAMGLRRRKLWVRFRSDIACKR